MTRERATREELINESRPERVPLHEQKRSVLTARNTDSSYVYRWVNDTINPDGSSRIEAFKKAGYVVDESMNVKVGDVDGNASLGTGARASVGKGRQSILMKIPKDLYEQDQKDKQAVIDRQEKLMLRRKKEAKDAGEDGNYGEVALERK